MQSTETTRRMFIKTMGLGAAALAATRGEGAAPAPRDKRPNILFAIADDWSWPHAGVGGNAVVQTPAFDRVAREGVLFSHAFVSAPSCTPSRGAILTGQWHWRLEEGANLWSTLPAKFDVYPDLLEAAGYHVGFTRKGWGPGAFAPGGRDRNPAGPSFKNFEAFMKARPEGKPFCFWFGSHDPHRGYEWESGVKSGMNPDDVAAPSCFPDSEVIRKDICDYYFEVQRFDREVGGIIERIEEAGELDDTLVVITGDNGMPFPRCKSNLYDLGTRVPLAARWGARVKGGRAVEDFISLTDLAPTFLEAAGLDPAPEMTGRSFFNILTSAAAGRVDPMRDRVFTGKERHTLAQEDGKSGYPMRAVRTHDFLYIRNFEPDRWPAGTPEIYRDIDNSPTKTYMMEHAADPRVRRLFEAAFGKRPAEELYDLREDPDQLKNVAGLERYRVIRAKISEALTAELRATKDPRAFGRGAVFDDYPYKPGIGNNPPRKKEKRP